VIDREGSTKSGVWKIIKQPWNSKKHPYNKPILVKPQKEDMTHVVSVEVRKIELNAYQ
jgi:hypothetical protein